MQPLNLGSDEFVRRGRGRGHGRGRLRGGRRGRFNLLSSNIGDVVGTPLPSGSHGQFQPPYEPLSIEQRVATSLAAALRVPTLDANQAPETIQTIAVQALQFQGLEGLDSPRVNQTDLVRNGDILSPIIDSSAHAAATPHNVDADYVLPSRADIYPPSTGTQTETSLFCSITSSDPESEADILLSQFQQTSSLQKVTSFTLPSHQLDSDFELRRTVETAAIPNPRTTNLPTVHNPHLTEYLQPSPSRLLNLGRGMRPQIGCSEDPALGSDFIDTIELVTSDITLNRKSEDYHGETTQQTEVANRATYDDDDKTDILTPGMARMPTGTNYQYAYGLFEGPAPKNNVEVRVLPLPLDTKAKYLTAPPLRLLRMAWKQGRATGPRSTFDNRSHGSLSNSEDASSKYGHSKTKHYPRYNPVVESSENDSITDSDGGVQPLRRSRRLIYTDGAKKAKRKRNALPLDHLSDIDAMGRRSSASSPLKGRRRLRRVGGTDDISDRSISPVGRRRSARLGQALRNGDNRGRYNYDEGDFNLELPSASESSDSGATILSKDSLQATRLSSNSLAALKSLILLPLHEAGKIIPAKCADIPNTVHQSMPFDFRHSSRCMVCFSPSSKRSQSVSVKAAADLPPGLGDLFGCICCNAVVHAGCIGSVVSAQDKRNRDLSIGNLEIRSLDCLIGMARSWPSARGWAVGRLSEVLHALSHTPDRSMIDLDTDNAILVCKWCMKGVECVTCLGSPPSLDSSSPKFPGDSSQWLDESIFRCSSCYRAWHFSHLPPLDKDKYGFEKLANSNVDAMRLGWCYPNDESQSQNFARSTRHETPTFGDEIGSRVLNYAQLSQYIHDWKCSECESVPGKVSALLGWRCNPRKIQAEFTPPASDAEIFLTPSKFSLLVKFSTHSLRHARWMPASWVLATTSPMTLNNLKSHLVPEASMTQAIPWEEVAIDQVLDVIFSSPPLTNYNPDIQTVSKAYVSFRAFGLESATWEFGLEILKETDLAGWNAWEHAFREWVWRQKVVLPTNMETNKGIHSYRTNPFHPVIGQPEWIGSVIKTLNSSAKEHSPVLGNQLRGHTSDNTIFSLLPHQLDGLNWLLHHFYSQTNALLADEMGLGKTIQIAALVAHLVSVAAVSPWLIVVPGPTVAGWRREFARWAPQVAVGVIAGPRLSRQLALEHLIEDGDGILKVHAVVASYEVVADPSWKHVFYRKDKQWQGLVIDEAQRLKSGKGNLHDTLVQLNIPFRVLLSGTPLQNRPTELFNLLKFLRPGLDPEEELGLQKGTSDKTDVQALTIPQIAHLHSILRPLLLRRTKGGALGERLPGVASVVVPVPMGGLQKMIYKAILARRAPLLSTVLRGKGAQGPMGAGTLRLANALMLLRKCLCHPWVFAPWLDIEENSHEQADHLKTQMSKERRKVLDSEGIDIPEGQKTTLLSSPKLAFLSRILPVLISKGHRMLIFSQFLAMLDVVSRLLDSIGIQHARIDGTFSASEKQRQIDIFNSPNSPFSAFLLSTRAGGVGLNLATADTVIILDPDFNPQQDLQAIGRAHRIGQTKEVLSMHFVTQGSAEEKIWAVGRKKVHMERILVGGATRDQSGSNEDLPDGSVEEGLESDARKVSDRDLASILTHGATQLFAGAGNEPSTSTSKIDNWSDAQVEMLIDRSAAVRGNDGDDSFGFARIWENNPKEKKYTSEDIEAGPGVENDGGRITGGTSDNDVRDSSPANSHDDPEFWDRMFSHHEQMHMQGLNEVRKEKRNRTTRYPVKDMANLSDLELSDPDSDRNSNCGPTSGQGTNFVRDPDDDPNDDPNDSDADLNLDTENDDSNEDNPLSFQELPAQPPQRIEPPFSKDILSNPIVHPQKSHASIDPSPLLSRPVISSAPESDLHLALVSGLSLPLPETLPSHIASHSSTGTHPCVFSSSITTVNPTINPESYYLTTQALLSLVASNPPSLCPLCSLPHLGIRSVCPALANPQLCARIQIDLLDAERRFTAKVSAGGMDLNDISLQISMFNRAADLLRQLNPHNLRPEP